MSPYGQSLSQECFNFEVSCMSGSPSGGTLSNISRLDPWRTGGSWRTFWRFLMAWRCHVSILRCLVCQEPHQEDSLSTISRLDPWRTCGSWHTFWRFLMAWRYHVSIVRCLVCQEAHQEDTYPPSPGWIFGWQVVPDTHFGHIICPFGMIFQNYSLKDVPEAPCWRIC